MQQLKNKSTPLGNSTEESLRWTGAPLAVVGYLRRVMDMRRALTGGTQCCATSAPFPFSTRHEPAGSTHPHLRMLHLLNMLQHCHLASRSGSKEATQHVQTPGLHKTSKGTAVFKTGLDKLDCHPAGHFVQYHAVLSWTGTQSDPNLSPI